MYKVARAVRAAAKERQRVPPRVRILVAASQAWDCNWCKRQSRLLQDARPLATRTRAGAERPRRPIQMAEEPSARRPDEEPSARRPERRALTPYQRALVASEQAWRCNHCSVLFKALWHIDHVTPLADGGADHLTNMQALCADCHASKTSEENMIRTKSK